METELMLPIKDICKFCPGYNSGYCTQGRELPQYKDKCTIGRTRKANNDTANLYRIEDPNQKDHYINVQELPEGRK